MVPSALHCAGSPAGSLLLDSAVGSLGLPVCGLRVSTFRQFSEGNRGQSVRALPLGRQRGLGAQRLAARAATGGGPGGEGGRQPWDIGRFLQTLLFFNKPDLGKWMASLVAKDTGTAAMPAGQSANGGVTLVIGATGGVGKRVVDLLLQQGKRVRAMVRNEEKARKLLGPGVELVLADITQRATLQPEYFEGVTAVVNASAVKVGPVDDDEDRSKYYQGIKFFDPVIKESTPEAVEYRGMENLLGALKERLGLREGPTLFAVAGNGMPVGPAWGPLDDVVMGGVSQSSFQVDLTGGEKGEPVGVFTGVVSSDNNGGFASVRSKNFEPKLDLSPYSGIQLRIKGDGRRFKLILRTDSSWDAVGYTSSFDTVKGEWQTVHLPFSNFVPVFRARTVKDHPPLNTASIASMQLMLSKFEYDGALNPNFSTGPFSLPVARIGAFLKEPLTARFVHVGSAGVTRPKRPGLDLEKQPPAVRMNDMLGGLLTFKLKGEDVLRESGVPFAIIRPCALTEEPAGAELEFAQGDNITGKIGRQEIAQLCLACLELPEACDKTFEVKSTVPFSQPFTVDPANPPPPTDYRPFLGKLEKGITGKELLPEFAEAVAKA